ncbi:MAG: GNAT family N-acetyltransferase [Thermoplasmatota archaeon]
MAVAAGKTAMPRRARNRQSPARSRPLVRSRRRPAQRQSASSALRRAKPADGPEFLRLVRELARFEKLAPPTGAAARRLLRGAFDTEEFELYVIDAPTVSGAKASRPSTPPRPPVGPKLVGYVVVLWTYSSFLGKPTLYLEDLYLTPAARGTGVAQAAMADLAGLALERGAGRLEGIVLRWNRRARRFYRRGGAQELADWLFFRYDEKALRRLATTR